MILETKITMGRYIKTKIFKTFTVIALLFLSFSNLAQALTIQEILQGHDNPKGRVLGSSTPAFAQSAVSGFKFGATSVAVTVSGVAAGDLLALACGWNTSGISISSISDTSGNSWTVVDTISGAGGGATAYAKNTAAGSTTITVNLSASMTGACTVHELSGVDTTAPLDGHDKNTQSVPGTGANAVTSGSIATASSGDYIFGASLDTNQNNNMNAGTGFTSRIKSSNNVNTEDSIQVAAGSVAATFTEVDAFSVNQTFIMAFKPASGGGGDTTAPSVPASLSASAVSSSAIALSWTASSDNAGVTGYTIYRGGVQIGTSAVNSYSDSGLISSTLYTYTVDAFDAAGNHSVQSSSASATTQVQSGDTTPPTTPTNLSASAVSSSAINLSWTASSDNVGVTGYKIFRGGAQIGTSAVNSYSDTGLTASTAYTYTVSAYDAAVNNSVQSAPAGATTLSGSQPDTSAPSVPAGLAATAVSSSGINLSWTASSDNVAVTGYTIYRGGAQIGTSAGNSYSDTGLTASTAYTYTVSAYDAAGNNSAQSSGASATTQAQQGNSSYSMETFSGGTAGAIPTAATLTAGWISPQGTGASAAVSGAISTTGALTYSATPCGGSFPAATGNSPVALDYSTRLGKNSGNQIIYLNQPSNASNVLQFSFWYCSNIPASSSWNSTGDMMMLIDGSASRFANFFCNGANCGWNFEGNNQGEISYTPGTWVEVVGQYVNGGTCQDHTNFSDCLRMRLYDVNGNRITNCWGSGCLSDQYAATGSGGVAAYINLGNGNIVSSLPNGYNVQFRDLAICSVGCTTANFPLLAAVSSGSDVTAPTVPTNLSATAVSSSGINLSWTASTDNVGVTGYKIFRGGSQIGTSVANSYSDNGLVASTAYTYTVLAYDAAGNNSDQSSSAAATTQAAAAPGTVIDAARKADWTQAGIPGDIPSGGWTQCGATIAAYTGAPTTITNQLAGCAGQNKFVLLGPGTFNLSGPVVFPTGGGVVLRGSGANSTFITGTGAQCGAVTAKICVKSSDSTYFPASGANWTAGYAQGSSQITLSSTAGINTSVPSLLMLDQDDTGYTGQPPSGSTNNSVGGLLICGDHYVGATGCTVNGNNGYGSRQNRNQAEINTATAINGNVLTLSHPLIMPNWAASQSPQVWVITPITNVGVENLAIDGGSAVNTAVEFFNAYHFWLSGTKAVNCTFANIGMFQSANGIVRSNYIGFNSGTAPSNYGIRSSFTANVLVENNIFQQLLTSFMNDGAATGNVYSYNFCRDTLNNADNFMSGCFMEHDGDFYELFEGNVGNQINPDIYHAANGFATMFRNFLTGWESNPSVPKSGNTNAVESDALTRYHNIVGNVLGTPGFHNIYKVNAQSNTAVLAIGAGVGAASPSIPNDPLGDSTSMYWGNYDVVTGATRWNANEVPSGISPYANPVPASQVLPASLYLAAKPAWWPSAIAWPPIGPDMSGGNVGICSGALNTAGHFSGQPALASTQCAGTSLTASAWGGHVNANPAMNCALNVMGMPVDGTGGVLAFDPSSCYGSGGGSNPAPSISSFTAAPGAINYGSSATLSWTTANATSLSIDNGVGSQANITSGSVSVSPAVTTTYTLTATNAQGSVTSQLTVTVNPNPDATAPTVSITSPSAGTVSGSLTFSASASDPVVTGQVTSGLKLISIFVDGGLFATSTTSSVSKPLDTTTLTNASHTLTASATDNAGNVSTVASVTVTVNNVVATKYPRLISLTSLEGLSVIPANQSVTVTVVSPANGSTLETQSNLLPSSGKYTITFLSSDPQLVNIRVKATGYLAQLLSNIDTTVNSASSLSVPQMSAGDLNNDNIVNALDYSLMNTHWLQNFPAADINADSLINSLDFAILKNNYNKTGG